MSRPGMLVLLALAGATLSACTPTPEPSPTPTAAFASEEEAFAAAEETYRAYNDAVNRQRDGDTDSDPQAFLTALALENDINASRLLDENDVHIVGHGEVTNWHGTTVKLKSTPPEVRANLCLDVTATRVMNASDKDVTPASRPTIVALDVAFVVTDDGLKISNSIESTDIQC